MHGQVEWTEDVLQFLQDAALPDQLIERSMRGVCGLDVFEEDALRLVLGRRGSGAQQKGGGGQ